MARWLVKAALQKGMSALPASESVNYVFQRRISRSLPASEAAFRRKFERAAGHLRAYETHGPGRPPGEAVLYEFGAGWDLAVPLSYWALGVERQLLVDIHANLRFELVNVTLERLRRLGPELGATRVPDGGGVTSAARPRGAVRDRVRRAAGRAGDRVRRGVRRSRVEHEHAGAHSSARPPADPRRVPASPAAGGDHELAHRPRRPLLVLRPRPVAVQLPPLRRRALAVAELGRPVPEPHAAAGLLGRVQPKRGSMWSRRSRRTRTRRAWRSSRGSTSRSASAGTSSTTSRSPRSCSSRGRRNPVDRKLCLTPVFM